MSKPLITISIPVFNEAENVGRLLERLDAFTGTEPGYDFEFLFTDNASDDDTFALLAEAAKKDKRIRVLRFSRNFGFQRSIMENFLQARGVAAIQIDADLQDPPELMSKFLRKHECGYKVVYGVRRHRQEGMVSHLFRRAGYWTLHQLSEVEMPRDAGDFRLIDRVVIEHLRSVSDRTPFLRGLIASIGYPQIGIVYDRERRIAGKSKFRFFALLRIGIDGICSQSTRLLQFITIFALFIGALTMLIALIYILVFIFNPDSLPAGFTTIVLMQLAAISLNALFMGIIGEYIGRTYNNGRGLPFTIIERSIGESPPFVSADTIERPSDNSPPSMDNRASVVLPENLVKGS